MNFQADKPEAGKNLNNWIGLKIPVIPVVWDTIDFSPKWPKLAIIQSVPNNLND